MHHPSPQGHSYRGLQCKDGTASMAWGLSRKRGGLTHASLGQRFFGTKWGSKKGTHQCSLPTSLTIPTSYWLGANEQRN